MHPIEGTNPIKQDEKKGKPRHYNIDIKWNYGALPQTWEQPEHIWKGLEGYGGDDDPVDVVDISGISVPTGSVIVCKPLAALAMIDEGEASNAPPLLRRSRRSRRSRPSRRSRRSRR
jgi:inorganic pyrophosphatase